MFNVDGILIFEVGDIYAGGGLGDEDCGGEDMKFKIVAVVRKDGSRTEDFRYVISAAKKQPSMSNKSNLGASHQGMGWELR